MAHARRSPQHRPPTSSISSPTTIRRKRLRRATARSPSLVSSESISSPLPPSHRPVLVPLQPNLRRLPSRLLSQKHSDSDFFMRESGHVITVGTKRKRVASTNENTHTAAKSTRRAKRQRSNAQSNGRYYHPAASEESGSELSEMDIDGPARWSASGSSEQEEEEVDGEQEAEDSNDERHESTDEQLIHTAPQSQLLRLRKGDLIRLYNSIRLPDDPELLKKSEIVETLLQAREETASLPPSSPPGRVDGSSDYSSEEGNFAGDEETDDLGGPQFPPAVTPLRRRATDYSVTKSANRPLKNRSLSMGNLGLGEPPKTLKRNASMRLDTHALSQSTLRRRSSNRSSPTTSTTASTSNQSPPATRLRSRMASTATIRPSTPTSSSRGKGKAKAKQVEFSDAVEVHLRTPAPRRNSRDKERGRGTSSPLTELEDLEQSRPSPRRLRSQDRERDKQRQKDPDATPVAHSKRPTMSRDSVGSNGSTTKRQVRQIPMRQAKKKIVEVKEDTDEQDEDEDEEDQDEVGETEEEEEVDELVSQPDSPPESQARAAARRQLRPRRTRSKPLPSGEDENEGDDEEEEEAQDVVDDDATEEDEEEGDEGDDAEDDESEGGDEREEEEVEEEDDQSGIEEDDESTIAVERRKLRNGKVMGDEEEMDIDGATEEEEEERDEIGVEDVEEAEGVEDEDEEIDAEDADAEGEPETEVEVEEDDAMEDDVDLTIATRKTLVRLRRDDLIRLCEQRDLEPVGTKPQLAEALLQWRDQQQDSSPSSTGTVRPASNRRRRKGKQSSGSTINSVPVLFRSEQVHTDEPRTPVPGKEKEHEELELDLESLGLEDREIPPEKLTKLEKIGSGGFKDVFIGKFRGRRIAIAEFRGQLSAMDVKELKLLGAFNHPNIVRFLGVSIPENTKETPVMIVSELCSNGDLFDFVRNVTPPPLHKVLNMMLDIAKGLDYLHTRKPSIIHRDCKSSNILITAKGTAKIADFGLAKVKQSTRSMVRSLVGTVNWQAPELWHAHPKYNHKVDVFSCAMVYWEMLQWHIPNKKFPWEGMNEHAIYDIVGAKRQRPSVTGLRKQWCPEIVDLIERMWAHEHQDRPTMSEVVAALEEMVKMYRPRP